MILFCQGLSNSDSVSKSYSGAPSYNNGTPSFNNGAPALNTGKSTGLTGVLKGGGQRGYSFVDKPGEGISVYSDGQGGNIGQRIEINKIEGETFISYGNDSVYALSNGKYYNTIHHYYSDKYKHGNIPDKYDFNILILGFIFFIFAIFLYEQSKILYKRVTISLGINLKGLNTSRISNILAYGGTLLILALVVLRNFLFLKNFNLLAIFYSPSFFSEIFYISSLLPIIISLYNFSMVYVLNVIKESEEVIVQQKNRISLVGFIFALIGLISSIITIYQFILVKK